MLYLSMGDDATGGCPAQLTTSSLGCVMRMNVATLPPGGSLTPPTASSLDPGDNPLSANTDISQLVIAHGLRNPFRMEIDQLTGSLYIADVGQVTEEEYTEYVYPFEIAAVILLVAIIAAIALTLRRRKDTKGQDPSRQVQARREERVTLVAMPAEKDR